MGELIPDPTDPRKPAILDDERGTRLAPAVQMGPAGTEPPTAAELNDWPVIGYASSIDARPAPVSPDCADRFKHAACSGDAWDDDADEMTPCTCPCHRPVKDRP